MPGTMSTRFTSALTASLLALPAWSASAQDSELSDHYGFNGLEVVRIDPGAGPINSTDPDGDGHEDLIVVNNYKNRIELHHQKPGAVEDDGEFQPRSVNELPEHWRFWRTQLPAINRVTAVIPRDFDEDGTMDLIYAGQDPAAIVFMKQEAPGEWAVSRRHFLQGLMASRDSLKIADVIGDDAEEIIAVDKGRISIWPLEGDALGPKRTISGGDTPFAAIFIEDVDGNGLLDITGVSPDDASPVRIWLADEQSGEKTLGAQLRFEMPPLREAAMVRAPDKDNAMLAVIEKPSKRVVLLELGEETMDAAGDREAAYETFAFEDPGNRMRKIAVVDLASDGSPDILATNTEANAISIYNQSPERGLSAAVIAPSYAELSGLTAGDLDGDGTPEVYMVSEAEGVVGRSIVENGRLRFPESLAMSEGYDPVAADVITLDDGQKLAVIAKSGRKYALELLGSDGSEAMIDLGSMSRAPESTIALDADGDGRKDLLLLTPERNATLLLANEDGYAMVESPGQEKLLRSAGPINTAVVDFDGDSHAELLVADKNFIRALRFNRSAPDSSSGGWVVMDQINAPRTDINLVALEPVGENRIAAADRENGHIVLFEKDPDSGSWTAKETITLRGFRFDDLRGGLREGNQELLAIGDAGFALVRLTGNRHDLAEVTSWRPEDPRELPHELGVGDINADGMVDVIALDAGLQSARILGLTELKRLLPAISFEVFESRIFTGGEPRDFEPREVIIADLTGDERDDLVLLAHDRILLYPQDGPVADEESEPESDS